MIDVVNELDAVRREVATGRLKAADAKVVRLQRTYDAGIEDVWDALTNPDRIQRWFMPLSGDFRVGGTYQLEGNAGGKILACDRPNRFQVSWIYGEETPENTSEVEVLLTPVDAGRTSLQLVHTAVVPEEFWGMYGPGAVGVGWDGAILGLALHLSGGSVGDPNAWSLSDEGKAFNTGASERWGAATEAAGEDPETVKSMIAATTAFYTTDPNALGGDAAN